MTTQTITMKRDGRGYKSSDGKWFIRHEGTATWWYAVELDAEGWTIEDTKQYFRSYNEAKQYIINEGNN